MTTRTISPLGDRALLILAVLGVSRAWERLLVVGGEEFAKYCFLIRMESEAFEAAERLCSFGGKRAAASGKRLLGK